MLHQLAELQLRQARADGKGEPMRWFQGWGCVALAATMTEKQAAKTEKRIAKADKWAKRSLAVTNPVQSARNR